MTSTMSEKVERSLGPLCVFLARKPIVEFLGVALFCRPEDGRNRKTQAGGTPFAGSAQGIRAE